MTIGAGKSAGRLATTRDRASMPPAEEPITTSCASAAFVGTALILEPRRLLPVSGASSRRVRVSILAYACTLTYVRARRGLGPRDLLLAWPPARRLWDRPGRSRRPSPLTVDERSGLPRVVRHFLFRAKGQPESDWLCPPSQVRDFILTGAWCPARISILQDRSGSTQCPFPLGELVSPIGSASPSPRNMTNRKARGFNLPRKIAPEGDGIPHFLRVLPVKGRPNCAGGVAR